MMPALMGALGGEVQKVYATFDPLKTAAGVILSEDLLTATNPDVNAWKASKATIGKTAGKWYIEFTNNVFGSNATIGICNLSQSLVTPLGQSGFNSNGIYKSVGRWYLNNTYTALDASFVDVGTILGFAIDLDALTVSIYKNGVYTDTKPIGVTNYAVGGLFPAVSNYDRRASLSINFGQNPFTYSVPTGFSAGWYK